MPPKLDLRLTTTLYEKKVECGFFLTKTGVFLLSKWWVFASNDGDNERVEEQTCDLIRKNGGLASSFQILPSARDNNHNVVELDSNNDDGRV